MGLELYRRIRSQNTKSQQRDVTTPLCHDTREWCHSVGIMTLDPDGLVENDKSKVEPELYRWSRSYIGGSGAKSIGLGATQEPNGWSH